MRGHIAEQAFHLALEAIWRVVGEANRYVDEQAPWALRRSDPARMRTVLYTLAETLRHLAILVQPFVPGAAAKAARSAGGAGDGARFRRLGRSAARPGHALAEAGRRSFRALSRRPAR